MNDPLVKISIIAEKHRTIIYAYCLGSKTGLVETYSYVANVMLYKSG